MVNRLGKISPFGLYFLALGEFFSRKNRLQTQMVNMFPGTFNEKSIRDASLEYFRYVFVGTSITVYIHHTLAVLFICTHLLTMQHFCQHLLDLIIGNLSDDGPKKVSRKVNFRLKSKADQKIDSLTATTRGIAEKHLFRNWQKNCCGRRIFVWLVFMINKSCEKRNAWEAGTREKMWLWCPRFSLARFQCNQMSLWKSRPTCSPHHFCNN
jgi:hypothetical protein